MFTTDLKPTVVRHAGIEFNGNLYISDENSKLPLNCKELWIKTKIDQLNKSNKNDNDYIAKILQTKEKLGCVYDKNTEDMLIAVKNDVYVL